MLNKKVFIALILILLIGPLLSCGYRFSPGGENIDPAIQRIYIDNLGNRTSEANIESIFRNSLIDQFRHSSRFKLAESRDQADAILRGSIVSLTTSHLSYTSTNVAREDRVTAILEATFEARSKEIIWQNNGFSWYADYLLDPANPGLTDANRRVAIQKLANETGDRIYRAIMSGF